jgi:hypothetical protein
MRRIVIAKILILALWALYLGIVLSQPNGKELSLFWKSCGSFCEGSGRKSMDRIGALLGEATLTPHDMEAHYPSHAAVFRDGA